MTAKVRSVDMYSRCAAAAGVKQVVLALGRGRLVHRIYRKLEVPIPQFGRVCTKELDKGTLKERSLVSRSHFGGDLHLAAFAVLVRNAISPARPS